MQDHSGDEKKRVARYRQKKPCKSVDRLSLIELPQSWNDKAQDHGNETAPSLMSAANIYLLNYVHIDHRRRRRSGGCDIHLLWRRRDCPWSTI